MAPRAIFVTTVRTPAGKTAARFLIGSIRAFGGEMAACPIWVFATDPLYETSRDLEGSNLRVLRLSVPEAVRRYPFADKVYACARAEAAASAGVESLIWFDLNCLIVQPPVLFGLGTQFDAALRPVHIRNVGLAPSDPPDAFWRGVYACVGIDDVRDTVESFVDRRVLRAYFNSHALAVKPATGLFGRWRECFERLVRNEDFQASACQDETHRIFLFQAVLSALVVSSLDKPRIRILPPTYNYPYNLQAQVPEDRRAAAMNDLVCFPFEDRILRPDAVSDIQIREPLLSWLKANVPA